MVWFNYYRGQVLRTHFYFFLRTLTQTLSFAVVFWAVFALQGSVVHANSRYAGIVMDAKTGRVLYSHKSNERRYPASLTKMMTLYLVFEALEQKTITKKTRIKISKYAASKVPTKLGLRPGSTLSVEQAIYAIALKSANDVSVAIAEHLGGSEKKFARRMTKRARQLGMRRTTFRNASGLTEKGQVTSARDMALLGIALREHYPQYYHYFSKRSFRHGRKKYDNHNRLLGRIKGVDGIKTGYTRLSGYNLVSSAQSNGHSIVAVVIGGKSGKSRNAQMRKLISLHMKKATRSKKHKMLVAKISSPRMSRVLLAKATVLPSNGPIPLFRTYHDEHKQEGISPIEVVSVAYAPVAPNPHKKGIEAISDKLMAANNNQTSTLQAVPVTKPDDIVTSSIRLQDISHPLPRDIKTANIHLEKVLLAKAGSVPILKSPADSGNSTGWHVQVGAIPDYSRALLLLEKARRKMSSTPDSQIFDKLKNYLEPVIRNRQTLYRARFTGFDNKTNARSTCRVMKKQGISCLAIRGRS